VSHEAWLLIARPSALAGAASTLDFGDTLTEYSRSLSPQQADSLAAWADWLAVGKDLSTAMQLFDVESAPERLWRKTATTSLSRKRSPIRTPPKSPCQFGGL